jgi:hypothetical protein
MNGLTRTEQQVNTAYICPSGNVFVSPDGEGRIWYEIAEHDNPLVAAREDLGDMRAIQLTQEPED